MPLAAHSIVVERPVHEVYDDWTDDGSLTRRLGVPVSREIVDDELSRWTLPLGRSRHELVVREVRTSSRRDLVWLSVSGSRLAGRVSFRPLGSGATCVRLSVDFDPRNPVEVLAGSIGVPDRAVERLLERFKSSLDEEAARASRDGAAAPAPRYELLDHPRPLADVDLREPVAASPVRR